MPQALVTGGTGFIGRHLVDHLLAREWEVRCLVRPTSQVDHLHDAQIQLCQIPLHSPEQLQDVIDGVDTVFHLAGLTDAVAKRQLFETNGAACGTLADACRRVENPPVLVYVSSLAAAGPAASREAVRRESDPPRPISNYGKSKRLGELEIQKRSADLPCTVIRPGIVFGSHDRNMLSMFKAIYRYHVHVTVGYRTPPLSLIHVADLTRLIVAAGERGERLASDGQATDPSTGVYFASHDAQFPNYAELGRMLAKALGCRTVIVPLWRWVGRLVGGVCQFSNAVRGSSSQINLDKIREATVCSWACSSEKARQQLEFLPAEELDTSLKSTADWYLEQGWI